MSNSFRTLMTFLKPYTGLMILAAFVGAGTVLANVGLLATSAVLISKAAMLPPILDLMTLIVGVRFFGLSRAVLRYSERIVTHKVTFGILTKLRLWYYETLLPLVPGGLVGQSSGKLFKNILGDIELLKSFYLRVVAAPLVAALVLVITTIFLWQFAPIAAVILVLGYLLCGTVLPCLANCLLKNILPQMSEKQVLFNRMLSDYVHGYAELAMYGGAANAMEKLMQCRDDFLGLTARKQRIDQLLSVGISLFANLCLLLSLVFTVPMVVNGSLPGIFLAMVFLTVWAAFEGVQPIPQAAAHLRESIGAIEEMLSLASLTPRERASAMTDDVEKQTAYPIIFDHVSFSYDAAKPALKQISFSLPQGKWLVIAGKSGSGKSTLAALLQGFYVEDSGTISIFGTDIGSYSQEELSNKIAVLSQEAYLFNTTIRENLLLAKPSAKENELLSAIASVEMLDFVKSLPNGLDTRIAEGGVNLSGGEARRLALGRLFLMDRELIILDEPLRGLDNRTAREVNNLLRENFAHKTVIEISHTLHFVRDNDFLLLLSDGIQQDFATRRELEQSSAYFKALLEQENSIF